MTTELKTQAVSKKLGNESTHTGVLEVKRPGKALALRMQSQTTRSERQNPALEVKLRN